MRIKLTLIILCLGIILTFCNSMSAAFNRSYIGNARYIGMNGAYVGMADDEMAVFVNPAGLVKLRSPGFGLTFGDLYAGIDQGSLYRLNFCGGASLQNIGTFGLGIDNFMVSVDENVSYSETLYVLSFGRKIIGTSCIGISFKIPRWSSDLEGDTSFRTRDFVTSIDLGFMFIQNKKLSIGGAIYDINQPGINSRSTSKQGDIYYSSKFGISYSALKRFLTLNVDIAYYQNYFDLLAGSEVSFKDLFKSEKLKGLMMRGGIYLHELTEGFDFSLGAGYQVNIKNNTLQVDYAFKYPLNNLSGTAGIHFITTSFRFGSAKLAEPTIVDYQIEETVSEEETPKVVEKPKAPEKAKGKPKQVPKKKVTPKKEKPAEKNAPAEETDPIEKNDNTGNQPIDELGE